MRESKIKGTLYFFDKKSGKMVKAAETEPDILVVDAERTSALASRILERVGEAYLAQAPKGRQAVLEVLNALAMVAGLIIKGCEDPLALEFFSEALNKNLKN